MRVVTTWLREISEERNDKKRYEEYASGWKVSEEEFVSIYWFLFSS